MNNSKVDENAIEEYTHTQRNLLTDLMRRILRSVIPIEFKLFTNKCIKIKELQKEDTLEDMFNKIKENYEM